MSLHRALAALAASLAVLAPWAQAAGPDQIYVALTQTEPFDRTEAPEQKWEYLVIYPEGLALREIPSGGLDFDNIAKLAEKRDSKVGSYTRTEDGMQIQWGRSSRKSQTWELEGSSQGWTRGRETTFKRADRVTKEAIKGIWQQHSSAPSNMVDMSGGGEFVFRTNGEFEQGKKHGHYELDGYTLTLHDSTGTTRHCAIYRWPWAAGAIAVDKGIYQLLQARR